MDLLGRKLGMNQGKSVMDLLGKMHKTIAMAKGTPGLEELAADMQTAINKLGEVGIHMGTTAMSPRSCGAPPG